MSGQVMKDDEGQYQTLPLAEREFLRVRREVRLGLKSWDELNRLVSDEPVYAVGNQLTR